MRIGLDARFLGPVGKGLGRYTEKLLEYLQRIDQQNSYVIFLRPENFHYLSLTNPRFRKVLAPYRWYSWQEQVGFPHLLSAQALDLVHFPHFNVPILYRRPFVTTIHDLIITHFPTTRATTLGPFTYLFKRAGYTLAVSSAVRRASKIITVSEYTKRELISHFHLSEGVIEVTYEAADRFSTDNKNVESILRRYGIKKPYLLYVGNAYPHKNLETLLVAFRELQRQFSNLSLVLVGRLDYFYYRIKDESKKRGLSESVIFPGYIPDQDLPALYQQAELYVFPSLAEGFGLPPLEAMRYGTPVASSSYTCLPEILGDAAAYFDPKSKSAIVKVLSDLLEHPEKRAVLADRGFRQAERYSWEAMARKTLAIYQHAI